MKDKKIMIGRIGQPFGLQGWVHVFSFTEPTDNILEYDHWHIKPYQQKNAPWKPAPVEECKAHGGAYVVKLKGYNDREQALLLKNHTIAIDRSDLPELEENEFYCNDLIGFTVINTRGESFGVIDHFLETGSNDVIVTQGEKQHYIPYLNTVVKKIDADKKEMLIEWDAIV